MNGNLVVLDKIFETIFRYMGETTLGEISSTVIFVGFGFTAWFFCNEPVATTIPGKIFLIMTALIAAINIMNISDQKLWKKRIKVVAKINK